MSDNQYKRSYGANPYAMSELPPGIDCVIDHRQVNANYRQWLIDRGYISRARAGEAQAANNRRRAKRTQKEA